MPQHRRELPAHGGRGHRGCGAAGPAGVSGENDRAQLNPCAHEDGPRRVAASLRPWRLPGRSWGPVPGTSSRITGPGGGSSVPPRWARTRHMSYEAPRVPKAQNFREGKGREPRTFLQCTCTGAPQGGLRSLLCQSVTLCAHCPSLLQAGTAQARGQCRVKG